MSTKNLARTVIEGGRTRFSRFARRHSLGVERTRVREVSHSLRDARDFDEAIYPERKKVYRDFADKLGPARRWLRAQANRPWSKVRSELFARFDRRTTAGRHILFDHILREVEGESFRFSLSPRHNYFVDARGYLRVVTVRRKGVRNKKSISS